MQHLKVNSVYFRAVRNGLKTFEVRKLNDRSFFVGEVIALDEWDEQAQRYTGNSMVKRITYVLKGPLENCGLPEGVAVLALGKYL